MEKGHPDLETALNSASTLKTRMVDLELHGNNTEWLFFEFDTEHYQKKSSTTQIEVIERVYSEEGVNVMSDHGIKKSRVYVLNPNYVKKHVPRGGALARACRLYYFGNDSNFNAVDRVVDVANVRLRGVPKIAASDAKNKYVNMLINHINS